MKEEIKKCEHCGKELKPLNPEVEEYLEHKFCIKFFGWKLMLLKDQIEMGCPDCMIDERQSDKSEEFDNAVSDVIAEEIRKGNLIPNN